MRYRKWTSTGDYVFGQSSNEFWVNQAEAVAQAAISRLRLLMINNVGEWFLNTADGMPWDTKVLGFNTAGTRDLIIQQRILGTQGVSSITSFQSGVNRQTRTYSFVCTISTIYGAIQFSQSTPYTYTPSLPQQNTIGVYDQSSYDTTGVNYG